MFNTDAIMRNEGIEENVKVLELQGTTAKVEHDGHEYEASYDSEAKVFYVNDIVAQWIVHSTTYIQVNNGGTGWHIIKKCQPFLL